jgi:hypothetical protein
VNSTRSLFFKNDGLYEKAGGKKERKKTGMIVFVLFSLFFLSNHSKVIKVTVISKFTTIYDACVLIYSHFRYLYNMALRNQHEQGKRISEDYLSSTISSSTLEIVLDDRSLSDSGDEYSSDQLRYYIIL